MNFGKKLTEDEIVKLYLENPKLLAFNPKVTIKDFKDGQLMFLLIDDKKYTIFENKQKKLEWFESV